MSHGTPGGVARDVTVTYRTGTMPVPRSDQELLEAWRAGDRAAGVELFERYYDVMYRFFSNKVTQDRRDLIQQTFLACAEGRDRVRGTDRFRAYLFGVACNTLRAHLRSKYRATVDLDTVSVVDVSPSPEEVFVRHREERLLLRALRRISIERQIVLELSYWEGLSAAEIAEILDIPENTVRSRLSRASKDIKVAMEQLAASAAELASTVDSFDAWIERCRTALSDPGEDADNTERG
jgi:RNA polymerase sigma-70 factor (ECF subfamily)